MSEFLRAITPGALGTLQALLVGVAVVFGLLVGFCVLLSVPKLRPSGRQSKTVRGLDELVGVRQTFLAATAPRGRVDQLRTPELLEALARKSA
jgi:hypothetical protein